MSMGWKPKAEEDTNPGTLKAAEPVAPGKTTKTQSLPPAKKAPPPESGASSVDLLLAREPDDPFGLHLLAPEDLGLATPAGLDGRQAPSRAFFPPDEYLVRQDYALVKPLINDIASVDEYVARVKKTWGSCATYNGWRRDAEALLAKPLPSGGTVGRMIDGEHESERVFFYWVAWEYCQRGFTDAQIIALFDAQIVPELRSAIAGAEARLGAKIPVQGFCPRPQRNGKGYVMGTLSEHGLGRAVDIEPDKNPIIDAEVWPRMEALLGMHVDRSRRRWNEEPDVLYDDLVAFSELWAASVLALIESKQNAPARAANFARQHPGTLADYGSVGAPAPKGHSLLDSAPYSTEKPAATLAGMLGVKVAQAEAMLKLPGLKLLNHPRQRVLALREQGLVWGATFPNVDLHHFELAASPLTSWTAAEPRRPPPPHPHVRGPANGEDEGWQP